MPRLALASCGQRGIGRLVVLCPPSVCSLQPLRGPDAVGWCERYPSLPAP
jgi:hypothetical protein